MGAPALARDKWLEARRHHLGASDAAAVMGRSQYRSPIDVYLEKKEGKVDDETDYMRRGIELEPLVIYLYQQATGHEIIPAKFLVSKDHPWMAATLDIGDADLACPVQCKTVTSRSRDKYGDPACGDFTITADNMLQTHHEMIVSETKANQLAAFFSWEEGFNALREMMRVRALAPDAMTMEVIARAALKLGEFQIFPVKFNPKLAKEIIKAEKDFWFNHVQAGVPPICDALPQKTDIVREATKKERALLARAKKAYGKWKMSEEAWLDRKQELKNAIGENSGIAGPLAGKVTWKAPAPKTTVEQVTDYKTIAEQLCIIGGIKIKSKVYRDLLKKHTEEKKTTKKSPRVVRVPSREWKKG
jgi:putative phage-type endonuclease